MISEKRKIGFIINPKSGTVDKSSLPGIIDRLLDFSIYEIDIQNTLYNGHAREIAEKMVANQYYMVVAIGGDGTVNEVASALTHTNTVLGIIPCGSGNGLARHMEIPLKWEDAIELLNYHKVVEIDYGLANDIKFFCTCGVGFDAQVGYVFAQNKKRGFFNYLKSIMSEFIHYKPKRYKFKTGDISFKKQAFLVTFANASQYGNDAYIAPHADIQDGLIDVCILEPFHPLKAVEIGFKLMNKKIDQSRYIQILKTPEVKIRRKNKDVFHYDGEPCLMKKKITIKVVPRGLKIAVKPNAPFS